MCYNVSNYEDIQNNLELNPKRWQIPKKQHWEFDFPLEKYYFVNGYSHPQLPIVKEDGIFLYEWGLIPYWVKDTKTAAEMQNMTLNAVGETVYDKPSFKKSIVKQRCLIPVSGFFEWRDLNKVKYPYHIQVRSNKTFFLGGIYESWTDRETGEVRNTFSILTTPANQMMEKIHNLKKRMPLIIPEEKETTWIDPNLSKEQITELIKPYPESDMKAYTISKLANNARNDRNFPEILEPVEYPELILEDSHA